MVQAPSRDARTLSSLAWVALALLLPVPWIASVFSGAAEGMTPEFVAVFSGIAIVGAAFLLSWGAELAERDISQNLALVVLALLSILPEYAVDLTFAWIAGSNPEYVEYTVANMTGANRLLIGLGWPLITMLYAWKYRQREIKLDDRQGLEISFLLMATIYSFILPFKKQISLVDTALLFAMFGLYVYTAAGMKRQECEMGGPARVLDRMLGTVERRLWLLACLAYAGFAIWMSAHPFAEALVESGRRLNVSPFLLVQWVAPIASESPEAVVAILFALRAKPSMAVGALASSVVNQWTLLVGAIPLVYSLSRGTPSAMPLVPRQVEELLLTSGQSLFAVAILANFRFTFWEAALVMVLFVAHVLSPSTHVRLLFAGAYIGMAVLLLLVKADRRRLLKDLLQSRGRWGMPVDTGERADGEDERGEWGQD